MNSTLPSPDEFLDYRRFLAELDQAKDTPARNLAWEKISATRRFREARRVDLGAFEYLSSWAFPAILALGLIACDPTSDGTFVGNPGLTARINDNSIQEARSGLLVAPEIGLQRCDGTDQPLEGGPFAFIFEGDTAAEVVDLPDGSFCGLFVVVIEFGVTFTDDGGEPITVVAQNFDLVVPIPLDVADQDQFALRLGDDTWLEQLALYAEPGINNLNGSNPALETAYYDGLVEGSTIANITSSSSRQRP